MNLRLYSWRSCVSVVIALCAAMLFRCVPSITQSANASEVVRVWEVKSPRTILARLSPDGKRIWCADTEARKVSVLDATDGKALGTINASAYCAVFSPGSERLVLIDHEQQRFVVADSNGTLMKTIPYPEGITPSALKNIGTRDVHISGDLKVIYLALRSGRLVRIDVERKAFETVFDWRDYRDRFNFVSSREEKNAILHIDIVTSQKIVGRVDRRLFTFDLEEGQRPRFRVVEGRVGPHFAQVNRDNDKLFLTTWGEGSQLPSRVVVFDLKAETIRLILDRASLESYPGNMFFNDTRNRVVQIPASAVHHPSMLVISELRSGKVIETLRCGAVRSDCVSADLVSNSWIILDEVGNISLWKWKEDVK